MDDSDDWRWEQFHDSKNLALALSIEAAENEWKGCRTNPLTAKSEGRIGRFCLRHHACRQTRLTGDIVRAKTTPPQVSKKQRAFGKIARSYIRIQNKLKDAEPEALVLFRKFKNSGNGSVKVNSGHGLILWNTWNRFSPFTPEDAGVAILQHP